MYGLAGVILTLAIPFFMMLTNSDHHLDTAQSLCPFKLLTGLPCPGCGITKSLVYLYQGDLVRSLYYHIFGLPTFIFCVAMLVLLPIEIVTGKEYFHSVFYNAKVGWTLAAVLAAYHLVRLGFFIADNSVDSILRQSIWR